MLATALNVETMLPRDRDHPFWIDCGRATLKKIIAEVVKNGGSVEDVRKIVHGPDAKNYVEWYKEPRVVCGIINTIIHESIWPDL